MLTENRIEPTEAESLRELKALNNSKKFIVVQKFYRNGKIDASIHPAESITGTLINNRTPDYDIYFEPFDTQKQAETFLELVKTVSHLTPEECEKVLSRL